MYRKVNFRAIYRKIYNFEKDRVKEGNYNAYKRESLRLFTGPEVHYLRHLLIIDVSSDLFRKEEIDLLSLMFFGMEFQSFAPS